MKSFNYFLREKEVPGDLRSVLYHIARSVKYINFSIRTGNTGSAGGSQNVSGENQLALDVLADKIIAEELEKSALCKMIVSEEKENPEYFDAPRGDFFVAYDPLDGSSLVDANLAIGSIFGIWEHFSKKGARPKAREHMVASAYAVYGPRIILVIALKGKGVHEFELNDVGEFILTRKDITITDQSTYFAPGNLKACNDNSKYKHWVDQSISEGKTLRYSGGMVPDLHHILSKGSGIFCYPAGPGKPQGKLRLLFECAPFTLAFEEAGGIGQNQKGENILDTEITEFHQTSPIFIGSKKEVENVTALLR